MSLREAAQQALEALEERYVGALRDKAMDALRTALAEPDQDDTALLRQKGMTLHDYFAAQAMPRFILEYNSQEGSARAYAWADAMLKARGQE